MSRSVEAFNHLRASLDDLEAEIASLVERPPVERTAFETMTNQEN